MSNDLIASSQARVNVVVEVYDAETGEVLDRQETHNLVVTAGLNLLKDAMTDGTCAYPTHFALGTGVTAIAAADTTLEDEVFRDAITSRVADGSAPSLVLHYYLGSASANGETLAKAGLFTASSGGSLYAAVVLASSIAKTASVAVAFTWTLTWGAS